MKRNDAACCANCLFFIYDWCVKHQERGEIESPSTTVCELHNKYYEDDEDAKA